MTKKQIPISKKRQGGKKGCLNQFISYLPLRQSLSGYFLLFLTILFLYFHVAYINKAVSGWMVDDAFISFRYAENFASGKGLVYNEGEKVEGYTNFLWVILLSFFARIGVDIVPLSQLLSFIFATLIIIILFHLPLLLHKKPLNPFFSLIACLFLASNTTYSLWILSGMESHLFLLFIISSIGLYFYNPKSIYLPVLIVLATLTRPEGVLIFVATFFCKLIREKRFDKKFILVFLLLYLPYFIWRYSYYGFFFPNTFYAKVGGDFLIQTQRGLIYTYKFLKNSGGFLLLPTIFMFIGYRSFKLLYLSLIIFLFTIYIIYVGGDCLPEYRFFLPILPIIYLLVQEGIRYICNNVRIKVFKKLPINPFVPLIFCLLAGFIKLSFASTKAYINKPVPDKLFIDGKRFAQYLLSDSNSGRLIAVNSAGAIPYYSNLKAIDMLGLTDLHIAHTKSTVKIKETKATGHERHDGAYVLSKKPDYIIFGSASNPRLMFPGDLEIFQDERFIRDYEPVIIRALTGEGYLFVYYRRIKEKSLSPQDYEGLAGYDYMQPVYYAKMMLINKGIYYQKRKEYDQAILEFMKALKISPNDTKVLFELAMAYYYKGKINEAIDIFSQITSFPIQDVNIHQNTYNNLGSLYYKKGLFKEAFSCFSKTIQLNPNNIYAQQMQKACQKFLD